MFKFLVILILAIGVIFPLYSEGGDDAAVKKNEAEKASSKKISPEIKKLIEEIKMLNEEEAFEEIERAVIAKNKNRVKVIFYVFPKLLNKQDKFKRTPLFNAVYADRIILVKYLLSKKAKMSIVDVNGDSPLHAAAAEGLNPIIELLIKKGAVTYKKNKKGETPLYKAVSMGELETVSLLIEKGASVNTKDKKGNTALHRAAYKGHEEMVQFLLKSGAKKSVVNKKNQTPADLAKNNNIKKMLQQK